MCVLDFKTKLNDHRGRVGQPRADKRKKEGLHYPRAQTKASTRKTAPRGTVVATVRSYRYDYKCVRVSLAFRFCDQAH